MTKHSKIYIKVNINVKSRMKLGLKSKKLILPPFNNTVHTYSIVRVGFTIKQTKHVARAPKEKWVGGIIGFIFYSEQDCICNQTKEMYTFLIHFFFIKDSLLIRNAFILYTFNVTKVNFFASPLNPHS